MPSSHLYYALFTILLLSHLPSLSGFCATGQYYISATSTCIDQTVVTINIRPTLSSNVYLIVFEGGTIPFGNLLDFDSRAIFTIASTDGSITTYPSFSSATVTSDLSVIMVQIVSSDDIPYGCTLTLSWTTDYSTDDSKESKLDSFASAFFPTNEDLSSSDTNLIDVITDIDFILEIVWIAVSLLNPYWIIYMDCKLYRETLDLFKQVSVQYEPFLLAFYQQANTRKTAGLRIYNFFAKYVYGDSNIQSDWAKYQSSSVLLRDSDRLEDTKVLVNSQFFQFNDYPLFFDNYGSELVVLIACLILTLLFELNFRLIKQKRSDSIYKTISTKVRQLFWGLLLMTALGSCQTLTYYTAIQFQAFDSELTTNNKIGFGVAIGVFLMIIGSICTYVIISSKKTVFVNKMTANLQAGPLTFFDWILNFYKAEKLYQPLMILMVIVRSIIFSVIMILLNEQPIIQTAVMLGVTILCIIALILTKPFSRKMYMAFKFGYEFVIFLALIFLVVLASLDDESSYNTDERSILNVILIALWIAPPVLTIIFVAIGLIMYVKEMKWGTGEKRSVKITPFNEERKVINKKKIYDETPTTVKFADSPTYEVPTAAVSEPKSGQIFHPVPSSSVKNLEVPPVSILKPPARGEMTNSNRTEFGDSNANLLHNKNPQSMSMLNPGNQAPAKMPASSLVLDQQNNALRPPPHNDKRNSMINIMPRQQGGAGTERGGLLGNSMPPQGQQRPVSIATSQLVPQGEQQGPHFRNNSTNNPRGGARSHVLGVPNRVPFEVMELKLTPQSLRVIDQDGFKDYISPKEEGDQGNYVSSRNNMF